MSQLNDFITAFYSELPPGMDTIDLDQLKGFVTSCIEAMDEHTKQYALRYIEAYMYAIKINDELEKMDSAAKIFLLITFQYKTPLWK